MNRTFRVQFSTHTPYHYAYNSPVQWKDPSGLSAEDEKGEKVQSMLDLFDVGYFEDIADLGFSENRDYDEHWALGYDFYLSHDSPIALFNEFMQGHYEAFGSGGDGRTSKDGAEGGQYLGTKQLETPKDWSTESIDKVLEPAYQELSKLQQQNPGKKVGFFTVFNEKDNSYRAEFFLGKSEDTWLSLSEKPKGLNLSSGDVVTGFVHTHPTSTKGYLDHFGPDDLHTISEFSMGNLKWTKLPTSSSNRNPNVLDRMFFGVFYYNMTKRDVFSYKLTSTKGTTVLYNNIRYWNDGLSLYYFLTPNYGVDLIRRKKK